MTRSLILQDFSSASATPGIGQDVQQPLPDLPFTDAPDALESYDAGYKSGWADCAAAEAEEQRSVAVDLAKNLSEAKLTYEAARRDVLAALGPFFEDVAATLLPQIAAAALAPTVLAELGALADGQTVSTVEIHAAPSACAALERLGETEHLSGLVVRPEPAFAEGQVSIRVGAEQRDLDMAGAAARISEAIHNFSTRFTQINDQIASKGAA